MRQNQLDYDHIREALLSSFPELREKIEITFGADYDLNNETPEAYLIFEDVVKKLLFELLESGQNEALLARLFIFLEEMANCPDPNVSRDLLGIAILEPLIARRTSTLRALHFMGPKLRGLARLEALSQGRPNDIPDT